MSLTFNALRRNNIRRNKVWNPNHTVTPSFRGLELAGETGEVCNIIKKFERLRLGLAGAVPIDVDHLSEELADVIISADLIAMDFGIDLSQSIPAKFNKTSHEKGLQLWFDNKEE